MTFQRYMKLPAEKHNVEKWQRDCQPLSKRELQERYMRYCEEGGLTAFVTLRRVTAYSETSVDSDDED